jgi:hypothetical protein
VGKNKSIYNILNELRTVHESTEIGNMSKSEFIKHTLVFLKNNAVDEVNDKLEILNLEHVITCKEEKSYIGDRNVSRIEKPNCWVIYIDLTKLKYKMRGVTYDYPTDKFSNISRLSELKVGAYSFDTGHFNEVDNLAPQGTIDKYDDTLKSFILSNFKRIKSVFAPSKIYVFRLGTQNTSLVDNNAANLEGEDVFIREYFDRLEVDRGQFVTMFEVENLSGKYGKYDRFTGASSKDPTRTHMANPNGESIGREVKRSVPRAQWYSFPRDGAWTCKKIKTVELGRVLELARGKYKDNDHYMNKFMMAGEENRYALGFKEALKDLFPEYRDE